MRISPVAAAAACLCMSIAGIETSYAGGFDQIIQTSSIQTFSLPVELRTSGYAIQSPSADDAGPPKADFEAPVYGGLIRSYAAQYGVPADLAQAVIKVESNYNPKARGSAGEIGLMQIKPATARMMGYAGGRKGLFDPETNIKYGMKYLAVAHQLSGGFTCGTILRYNAGHGAKRMNPVSRRYCGKVQTLID